jgi:hypothetical protein
MRVRSAPKPLAKTKASMLIQIIDCHVVVGEEPSAVDEGMLWFVPGPAKGSLQY